MKSFLRNSANECSRFGRAQRGFNIKYACQNNFSISERSLALGLRKAAQRLQNGAIYGRRERGKEKDSETTHQLEAGMTMITIVHGLIGVISRLFSRYLGEVRCWHHWTFLITTLSFLLRSLCVHLPALLKLDPRIYNTFLICPNRNRRYFSKIIPRGDEAIPIVSNDIFNVSTVNCACEKKKKKPKSAINV